MENTVNEGFRNEKPVYGIGRAAARVLRARRPEDGKHAKKERAHGCHHAHACQRRAIFNKLIIAIRRSLSKGLALGLAALTVTGLLPTALAALQLWVCAKFGFAAFAACIAADLAVIVVLMRLP